MQRLYLPPRHARVGADRADVSGRSIMALPADAVAHGHRPLAQGAAAERAHLTLRRAILRSPRVGRARQALAGGGRTVVAGGAQLALVEAGRERVRPRLAGRARPGGGASHHLREALGAPH
eukprot:CAMPEP_0182874124 /NCGR_PEP_ID=MMETSP0034_2-20130328/12746_1 /TAXON_ID=156128 /ORGANISM="Nephroselmis pyriformis, Strain CCMP717" /LENGTH=120 /DNA_ID=CAMNT_0025006819 /DNA_START=206 /DNA_END=565 /DNA_ORIENTATION=+